MKALLIGFTLLTSTLSYADISNQNNISSMEAMYQNVLQQADIVDEIVELPTMEELLDQANEFLDENEDRIDNDEILRVTVGITEVRKDHVTCTQIVDIIYYEQHFRSGKSERKVRLKNNEVALVQLIRGGFDYSNEAFLVGSYKCEL